MGVLPTREGQAEVIQPMSERHAGDADAALAHIDKIRQAEPARRMLLPEDDVLLGAVECPPRADATFQRAPDTGADLGMAPPDLVEDGHRPQPGNALEQRYHFAVPNRCQRVTTTTLARCFPVRRQPRVLFDAIRGGDAEPGFGRSDDRRLSLTATHEVG